MSLVVPLYWAFGVPARLWLYIVLARESGRGGGCVLPFWYRATGCKTLEAAVDEPFFALSTSACRRVTWPSKEAIWSRSLFCRS